MTTLRERVERLIANWRDTAISGTRAEAAFALDKCATELAAALVAEGQGDASERNEVLEEAALVCDEQGKLLMETYDDPTMKTSESDNILKQQAASAFGCGWAIRTLKRAAEGLPLEFPDKPGQISVNTPGCDRCGKIFLDCRCGSTGAALHKEGAEGAPAERELKLKQVLSKHWLTGIHCHHAISPDDSTYDWATCACSKVNLPHRGTVGEAVRTWIEHVLDELAAGRAETCSNCGGKTWFTANGLCEICSANVSAAKDASP